jgi:chromosome segregation ATPase
MRREIRDGRTSADARENHLRSATDSLLNQLKTLQSQAIPVHKPSPQMDERDMIGTWRLKYTNISQQLTSSEERVSIREKEIRQSEEKVRKLTEKLEEAQAERNAAVQALNEAKVRDCAREGEIGKLQQKVRGFQNKQSCNGDLALRDWMSSFVHQCKCAAMFLCYISRPPLTLNLASR